MRAGYTCAFIEKLHFAYLPNPECDGILFLNANCLASNLQSEISVLCSAWDVDIAVFHQP